MLTGKALGLVQELVRRDDVQVAALAIMESYLAAKRGTTELPARIAAV